MATDIKTVEKIKALRAIADRLASFHEDFKKYEADSRCDKKGYGFGRDNRFSSFSIRTSFDSWVGYFGISSCSSALHVYSTDLVEQAFIKALNMHQRELFATTAAIMRTEAASLTDQASKELEALQKMLDETVSDISEDQKTTTNGFQAIRDDLAQIASE